MPVLAVRPARVHLFLLGVAVVLTTVITTLAVFTSPPVEQGLYVFLRGMDVPRWLSSLDVIRSVPFVIAVGAATVVGWRCRAFLVTVVSAVLVGAGLAFLPLAERTGPFDAHVLSTHSYPSPMLVLLAILAVLVPAAIKIATGSTAFAVASGALLWLVTVGSGVQETWAGERWPLDEAGGVFLGVTVALVARVALDNHRLHSRCAAGCPWQAEPVEYASPARPSGRVRRAHVLFRIAVLWTVVLAGVLAVLAVQRGIPRLPESGVIGTGLELPLHIGVVVVLLAGVLLAARWHVAGAIVVAFAATLLGYASSVEYGPWVAVVLAVAAFVPALLLWVQWHRLASATAVLSVAVVVSAMLAGLVYASATTYTYYWGPTHPRSVTLAVDDDLVDWMWAGGTTADGFTVRARVNDDADRVRLAVSDDSAMSDPTLTEGVAPETDSDVVSLTADGLEPDQVHYYALEVDGTLDDARIGHVRTFPEGPASFTFAVGGDSFTGSSGTVFDVLRETDPLLYLSLGDFFYGDVDQDDPDLYRRQYDSNLTAPAQAAVFASTSFAYTWGDHDFAGNDADRTAPGRLAALEVYHEYVPSYVTSGDSDAPIYQAFTVGDVRFLLTDNRSLRDPAGTADRSMLGAEQLDWLIGELSTADRYGLVVWANPDPWVDTADPTADTWGGFDAERRVIADAIAEHEVDNLLMVSADAHMLAYDDGTNTDYSASGDAGFPLFQAAALDRLPSVKGGPYTGPVVDDPGQFGTVTVRDDGTEVTVTCRGRNWKDEVVFTKTFTVRRDAASR